MGVVMVQGMMVVVVVEEVVRDIVMVRVKVEVVRLMELLSVEVMVVAKDTLKGEGTKKH